MTVNICINGAGRIGLIFLRILSDRILKGEVKNVSIAMINDPFAKLEDIQYRLTYDSAHGRFAHCVSIDTSSQHLIIANRLKIALTTERDPAQVPYAANGIGIVVECSGVFTKYEMARKHVHGPVKHVLISAPGQGSEIKTLVYGVNHTQFDCKKHLVVSNASCTTNCLAPLIKVLNDQFGIEWGLMTTTHAATATQKVVDGVSQKDFASGRSVLGNIIPASTGAAKAIGLVFPELNGKLDGMALRVPTIDVSVTDFVVETKKSVSLDKVRDAFERAAGKGGCLEGILGVAHEYAVSSDFLSDPRSSIADLRKFIVHDGRIVKGLSFYDNEFGYSARLADLLIHMANETEKSEK